MKFYDAMVAFFVNWLDFRGRALRSEFWWPFLFQVLFVIFISILMKVAIEGANVTLYTALIWINLGVALILFVPMLSVGVRRLHDVGKSGWWWGAYFILAPIVAFTSGLMSPVIALPLAVIVLCLFINVLLHAGYQSKNGENEFGPPRDPSRIRATEHDRGSFTILLPVRKDS